MGRLTDSEVAAWVAASCAAQGLPVKVTDVATVSDVCVLLGGGAPGDRPARQRGRRPVRAVLEPPPGVDTAGIDGLGTGDAREDDGMVKDGGDDGVLADEIQPGPLSA